MRFVWDESKDTRNRKKHGISFEEAGTLFTSGDEYLDIFDEEHSYDEDRFIAIGAIARGVVVVAYTEQENDTLRIISARRATRHETEMYRLYIGGRSL